MEERRPTVPASGKFFQEMTIYDNVQKYLYMGREILDYSGKNLGVMLIRLSETNNLGKTGSKHGDRGSGAIYILDRNNNILVGYNEKYQKTAEKSWGEQESVKESSEKEIITGNLEDDFYYIAGELENASNKLVYLVPREIPEGKQKDSPAYSGNGIAGNRIHGLYYVIFFQKARQTSG